MKNLDMKSVIIGMLSCACMFLIMGQSPNARDGNFETITAKKIIVDGPNGRIIIGKGFADIFGLDVIINNVSHSIGKNGFVNQNFESGFSSALTSQALILQNEEGLLATVDTFEEPNFSVYNKGEKKVKIGLDPSDRRKGSIALNNEYSNLSTLISSDKGDGIIILNNKYGDTKWFQKGE